MENDVESSSPSTEPALTPPALPSVENDPEKIAARERKIILTAEESIQHTRAFPDNETPL